MTSSDCLASIFLLVVSLASSVAAPAAAQEESRLGQTSSETLFAAAWTLQEQGQFASATALYKHVLQMTPGHAEARSRLAECYAALGYFDEAERILSGGVINPDIGARVEQSVPGEPAPAEIKIVVQEAPPPGAETKIQPRQPSEAAKTPESSARKGVPNPRSEATRGGAIAALGPTLGLGVHLNLVPRWMLQIDLGIGGVVWANNFGYLEGAGSTFVGISLMPLPTVVTPTLGVGVALAFGELASSLPGIPVWSAPDRLHFLPYWTVGIRVDTPKRIFFTADVSFVPEEDDSPEIVPIPGFRFGLRLQ